MIVNCDNCSNMICNLKPADRSGCMQFIPKKTCWDCGKRIGSQFTEKVKCNINGNEIDIDDEPCGDFEERYKKYETHNLKR